MKGNRYSPSYLAIIACVACFSKSLSFPAIANCSAIELPVFGRVIVDVVLEDFRVRRLGLHEKNPRRGYFSLSTFAVAEVSRSTQVASVKKARDGGQALRTPSQTRSICKRS